MTVYVGLRVECQPVKSVLVPGFDEGERLEWSTRPWFVTKSGGLRRDICVAGFVLRVVLQQVLGGIWRCLVLPVGEGDMSLSHGYKSQFKGMFLPVGEKDSAAEASQFVYDTFRPGPLEDP